MIAPEDVPFARRVLLAVAIVLLAVAFVWLWPSPSSEQEQLYRGVPLTRHLLELDRIALEDAYRDHLKKLWSVWLTDGARVTDHINRGLKISRDAYAVAGARIEDREQQLQREGK